MSVTAIIRNAVEMNNVVGRTFQEECLQHIDFSLKYSPAHQFIGKAVKEINSADAAMQPMMVKLARAEFKQKLAAAQQEAAQGRSWSRDEFVQL